MDDFGFLIKQLDKKIKESFDKQLESVDLTFSQMRVMCFLGETFKSNPEKKVNQKEISTELGIKHSTTIGILKRLQEKQMVEILTDDENRKYRNVIKTKKADEIEEQMKNHKNFIESRITNDFTEQEKVEFNRLLNKALYNLE